ncbi:helix-turn-helix domain-containing protein [Vallitalea guaymasensis]|uniref:Helix-turn-helix domain-containing protein n=1 Tax=Vallitalea guaymasensis TaxID=1185412 RepID=A0A8J8M8H5_9FIRM|nr:helix-turn-helix domain-containing protein [Vallitalea guaymasensis]QUH28244.1 helix-turn-helix domain-containing protein [Vallitalea guaymasensis]
MERDFKGIWIPKEIWLSQSLTTQEKLFLVEIDSLDNNGGCYAMNEHFSNFFKLSKNRCSEVIKSLETKGFIKINYIKEGKQIIKRVINVINKQRLLSEDNEDPLRDTEDPLRHVDRPPSENLVESNTVSNNTVSNIYSKTNEPNKSLSNEKKKIPYQQIVDKYNEICVSLPKVQKLTDKRKKFIRVLYNSNFINKDIERIYQIFELAEKSDFLSGRNGKWLACNFDWLIKSDNPVKILEGTYANRAKPQSKQKKKPVSGFINYEQTDGKQYEIFQKKLDLKDLLELGKITPAEYLKKIQELESQEE